MVITFTGRSEMEINPPSRMYKVKVTQHRLEKQIDESKNNFKVQTNPQSPGAPTRVDSRQVFKGVSESNNRTLRDITNIK